MGFFYRTIRIVENGIKPAYVFDGKPPELKSGVVSANFFQFCDYVLTPPCSLQNVSRSVKKQKEEAMKSVVKSGKGVTVIGKKSQDLKKGKKPRKSF